ncbi:MAG: histidine phosphatase family protein [Candidatus Eisenbacteria bacterium]
MRRLQLVTWTIAATIGAAWAGAGCATAQGVVQQPMAASRDTTLTGYRYLYLVRHGWYDFGDKRDDRIGMGLDSLGRVQARLVGERLAALPVKIHSLTSSTLTRARETADDIGVLLRMQPERDSLISECQTPSLRADLNAREPQADQDACQARMLRAYARYVHPAGSREDVRDVLVAHGNVIRWFVTKTLGLDTKNWTSLDLANGSITVIAVRPDGMARLVAFSDTGHLPPAAQTWTGRGAGWSPPAPRTPRPAVPGIKPGRGGIVAPANEAAFDTLRHKRPAPGNR